MKRLFVAIELPPPLKDALTALQTGADGIRWVRPAGMHLTLRFIGSVEPDRVDALAAAVDRAAASHDPLQLQLQGGGAFPTRGRPRVLWVGLAGDVDRLCALVAAVERELIAEGVAPETRSYHPHVTLGRVKRGDARADTAALAGCGILGDLHVHDLVLYESRLRPDGAHYRALHRASLTP